jgi:hypothetical protein
LKTTRLLVGVLWLFPAGSLLRTATAADLIVSANDGKFVRVEGTATYPRPAPPDSLIVIDAAQERPGGPLIVDAPLTELLR